MAVLVFKNLNHKLKLRRRENFGNDQPTTNQTPYDKYVLCISERCLFLQNQFAQMFYQIAVWIYIFKLINRLTILLHFYVPFDSFVQMHEFKLQFGKIF